MTEHRDDCERYERLTLDRDEGRNPTAAERNFLEAHQRTCSECDLITRLTAVLGDPDAAAIERPDDLARRRWLDRLLEREQTLDEELTLRSSGRSRLGLFVGGGVAAGAAFLVLAWALGMPMTGERPGPATVGPGEVPARQPDAAAIAAVPDAAGSAAAADDLLRPGQALDVGAQRLTAALAPGVLLTLDEGARLEVLAVKGPELAVRLERGRLRSVVRKLGPAEHYRVVTRFGAVEVTGTEFEVWVGADHAEVSVAQGEVVLRTPDGRERALRAGEQAVLGAGKEASPAAATRTEPDREEAAAVASRALGAASVEPAPDDPAGQDLLAEARLLRDQQEWAAAVQVYRRLIMTRPRSSEAGAARVAMGAILLEQLGDLAAARDAFLGYLEHQPAGSLAPEALHGAARAHRGLGEAEAEGVALRGLTVRYPDTVQARQAARRLRELDAAR